jgi:hypothetical protein
MNRVCQPQRAWLLRTTSIALAGAACVVLAPQASAQTLAHSPAVRLSLGIDAAQPQLRTVERLPSGFIFNQEAGRLSAKGLSAGLSRGDWALQGHVQAANGTLGYRGINQIGLPIETSTDYRIEAQRLAVIWSPAGVAHLGLNWAPAVGAVVRGDRWDRRIRPTALSSSLREVFESSAYGVTAQLTVAPSGERWSAWVQWDATRAARSKLLVDTYGAFDLAVVRPRARWQHAASTGVDWALPDAWAQAVSAHRLSVGLEARVRGLQPGPSDKVLLLRNGVPRSQIEFPGARWNVNELAVQFRTVW